MRNEETRTIELNHEQAKQLRRAISLAFRQFDCIEEEERFYTLSNLYDIIEAIEEELEK